MTEDAPRLEFEILEFRTLKKMPLNGEVHVSTNDGKTLVEVGTTGLKFKFVE